MRQGNSRAAHRAGAGVQLAARLQKFFAWLTDFPVNERTVEAPANRGGRLRWKIEKEGFNAQKNGGYELEHAYSRHDRGAKNFYDLLRIAHRINQVLEQSNLIPDLRRTFVRLRRLGAALLESLRCFPIPASALDRGGSSREQVRIASP